MTMRRDGSHVPPAGGPDGGLPSVDASRPPGDGWVRLGSSGDAPPSPGRHRHSAGRRRYVGYVLVAVLALIVGLGVGYVHGYFEEGEIGAAVTVVVPQGASLEDIADRLAAKGVVTHAEAFVLRAERDGYATRFLPGTYRLHENTPYDELVAALLEGTEPETVKVMVPEGSTLRQAAKLVAARVEGISADDYVEVARDDPPTFRLEGYKKGTTLEGMLFPATYEVAPEIKARAFVAKQLDAFEANFAEVDMKRAEAANLTAYDVVIIASMIEREAKVASERRLVAAVVWNRLHKGMLLEFCSTVQYALGKTKPVLTYDDLEIDSPYNTYKHAGLPPTPISNPGLASLQAAADPADVDYLYFVARDDGSGRHYFSSDYGQFLKDKARAAANAE